VNTLLPVDTEKLPRSFVLDAPLTDAEFEALCRANEGVQFERTKEGVIRMNPPDGGFTGDAKSEINYQLRGWWEIHRQGRVFDSNTGFYLPDGSMLSPDAAYVSSGAVEWIDQDSAVGDPAPLPGLHH
jgi:Uma2 family endonuclease